MPNHNNQDKWVEEKGEIRMKNKLSLDRLQKKVEKRGCVLLTKEAWEMNQRFLRICQKDRDDLIKLLRKGKADEWIQEQGDLLFLALQIGIIKDRESSIGFIRGMFKGDPS